MTNLSVDVGKKNVEKKSPEWIGRKKIYKQVTKVILTPILKD
jgi:hypothetical protein